MKFWKTLWDGIVPSNPIFMLALSLCPALAVTNNVKNGLGMGIAVLVVITASEAMISALRKVISGKIRLPAFMIIIAAFVTVIELLIHAYFPEIYKSLGIYLPLIVVFTLILARSEVFASKNPVYLSFADGFGMGVGFLLGMVLLSGIREIIGFGTFLDYPVLPHTYKPALILILSPGGFFVTGILMGVFNWMKKRGAHK
ncbi:MAG: electron transport complex subunit E [Firmicutes bacterium]|nr:electron transport complex subunit E [Bacillota bacterium]